MKNPTILLLSGLFGLLFSVLSFNTYADCHDSILGVSDHGKDISVHYHNNKYKFPEGCRKYGHDKHWTVPHRSGKKCAIPRVDGCSFKYKGMDFKYAFTKRDQRLMTPSCNQHDICYNTLGNPKHRCDMEFRDNLKATHHKFHGTFLIDDVVGAVIAFGKKGYDGDQKWARDHCR